LLRRGESGGERSFAFAGELRGSGGCRHVLEQLGNAEGTLKAAADCPGAVLGEEDPISLALNY